MNRYYIYTIYPTAASGENLEPKRFRSLETAYACISQNTIQTKNWKTYCMWVTKLRPRRKQLHVQAQSA